MPLHQPKTHIFFVSLSIFLFYLSFSHPLHSVSSWLQNKWIHPVYSRLFRKFYFLHWDTGNRCTVPLTAITLCYMMLWCSSQCPVWQYNCVVMGSHKRTETCGTLNTLVISFFFVTMKVGFFGWLVFFFIAVLLSTQRFSLVYPNITNTW